MLAIGYPNHCCVFLQIEVLLLDGFIGVMSRIVDYDQSSGGGGHSSSGGGGGSSSSGGGGNSSS
jgi:hypothetical protein